MLFTHFLDQGASINPDGDAFIDGGRRYPFKEVQRFTYRFANKLRALGLGLGAKGSILSFNDAIAFQCAFGLHRAGVAWIPANPRNSIDDLQYTLDRFDCAILVFHSHFAAMVRDLRARLPKVSVFVCLDCESDDVPSLERWLEDAPDTPATTAAPRDAVAMIMPTGGTTGRPKGVMLTQRNLYAMVATYMICFAYAADERPVVMAAAPLTHAAGPLSLPTLARGGTAVILSKPDIPSMLDAIKRYQVTEFFLPPTVIYRMLDYPGIQQSDFASVRYFGYGSAPMSVEKLRHAIDLFGPRMTQFFGLSEAPALCTFLAPQEHVAAGAPTTDEVLASCGRPTPLVNIRILDENRRDVSPGQSGEVCVAGDLVTPGYYGEPELTAATIVDGWLHTGDIGYFDGSGRLHLCDRKKDMIISGGLNIYPQEIEQVLWSHQAVQDCAVIGAPDPEWGELVTAVVELRSGATVSAEELLGLCRSRLGSVKVPKRLEFVAELPRSPNGKVLKRVIRDRYWSGMARKI
jgi:acyl-CoA synthetase (AMP-forming)/AMP-acid ligase II